MKKEILLGSYLYKTAEGKNWMHHIQDIGSKIKDSAAGKAGELVASHAVHALLNSKNTFKNKVMDLKHNSAVKRALLTGGAGLVGGGLAGLLGSKNDPNDPETKEKRLKNMLSGAALGGVGGAAGGYVSRLKKHVTGGETAKGVGAVLSSFIGK